MRIVSRSTAVPALAVAALLLTGLLGIRWALSSPERKGDINEKSISVVAAQAAVRDVPIYRAGIGFVEAFNRVSLTSRVEGQLLSVSFKEGQEVKAGEILALIDPRPFEAALRSKEAILRAAQAKAIAAKANLDRMAELIQREVGTKQALENQQALYSELVAQIDGAEAETQNAMLQLEYTAIRSPIEGRVGLKQVDQGNLVRPGVPVIAIVTQVKPISVIFSLPQEDLAVVNEQMVAGRTLSVVAIARDSKVELGTGKLATIDNQVDSKTGTFKLKAVFENEKNNLWPGQFVSVRLIVEDARRTIVVPAAGIQRGPDGTFVYVVDALYKAAMRPVTVEFVQDGFAVIKDGLTAGESVIVEGQFKLRPGSSVELRDGGKGLPAISNASGQRRG